jgi:hypothetical protein
MDKLPRVKLRGEEATVPPSPRRSTDDAAAFLHDSDLLGQEWVREGVEQLKRRELVERAALSPSCAPNTPS